MDADDLYGLALDEFVAQRAALAKALRADKRRDEAAAVAALRRPSIAAWAVNQLVRTQRDAVRALFEAGDGLRGAQQDLLAGRGDGHALRTAGAREREAVDRLVEAARGLLTSGGHELSAAVVERVDDTLHAAALDEEARGQVRDGRLERELRHVGLGLGLGEAIAATPAPRAPKRADAAPAGDSSKPAAGRAAPKRRSKGAQAGDGPASGGAKPSDPDRKQTEAERNAERERAAARKAARAAETAARRRADAAARALRKAEGRREIAAQALREADDALMSARDDAQAATAELEHAQAARGEI